MAIPRLEHVNITVSNATECAQIFCTLFGWKIRWHGPALAGGTTYHVGGPDSYIALYSPPDPWPASACAVTPETPGSLNHIGIVVDDLAEVRERVRKAGFTLRDSADYAPGKRFYFDGPGGFEEEPENGLEIEVVSYTS